MRGLPLNALVARVFAVCVAMILGMLPVPTAAASPLTVTDRQYLAALRHGGLCCPQQSDIPNPILRASSQEVVEIGRMIGKDMAAQPTYANFQRWSGAVHQGMGNVGIYLNRHESGKVVIIATHYYAGAAAECSLMKEMGGAMGEAPYWYGPVTYSGGLAVQPGCINFDR